MTSSSIPTIFLNTKHMLRKYSDDSELKDHLPEQTNASSTLLPANTSDICCPLKASPWPSTRSKSFKIGWNPGKSRTSNPSSVLPTSTITSFTDIPRSPFHSHVLPRRVVPGTFLMSAVPPLKHLKRLSPQLWSLHIGFWTLKLQSRLMPLSRTDFPMNSRM